MTPPCLAIAALWFVAAFGSGMAGNRAAAVACVLAAVVWLIAAVPPS